MNISGSNFNYYNPYYVNNKNTKPETEEQNTESQENLWVFNEKVQTISVKIGKPNNS